MEESSSPQNGSLADRYCISVDSVEMPTYAALCAVYDRVYEVWDPGKFEPRLHEALQGVEPVKGEVEIVSKGFARPVSSWPYLYPRLLVETALSWARVNGYRPLFPWEREALMRTHRELRRNAWFIDLGSYVIWDGVRLLARIVNHNPSREDQFRLEADEEDLVWRSGLRFLFARKA